MGEYNCYCFDANGRYGAPEVFENPEDALAYVSGKRNLFPRIIITDMLDSTVFEMVNGIVVFPKQEDINTAEAYKEPDACDSEEMRKEYIERLNRDVFPQIKYDVLQASYGTADKSYAKEILQQMHDAFAEIYGTDELEDGLYEMVAMPAVIKGIKTDEICIGLVDIDLSSSGEHYDTVFLTEKGVVAHSDDDISRACTDFLNAKYSPYEYYYTIGIENDIHVDFENVPEDVQGFIDCCRKADQDVDMNIGNA